MFLSQNSLPSGVRPGTSVSQIPEATLGMRVAAVNQDYSTSPSPLVDARPLLFQLVRNTSGGVVLPRRGLIFNTVAGDQGKNVKYAGVGDRAVGIVDPWIGSAGVPDDDYFLMVIPDERGTPVTVESDGAVALVVGDTVVPVANGRFTAGAGGGTAGIAEETAVAVAGTQFRLAFTSRDTGDGTQTVTPNSGGEAASAIRAGVSKVTVGAVTTNADDFIVLPSLASVPNGHEITILCSAGTDFELRTPAASDEEINSLNCDGTEEYLCTDTEIIKVVKINNTIGWMAHAYSAIGAVVTAVVPD